MLKPLFVLMTLLSMVNTASAHTGMMQYSFMHSALHIITSVLIYLAIMGAGFYLIKKLQKPKARRVRVRIKT